MEENFIIFIQNHMHLSFYSVFLLLGIYPNDVSEEMQT
jgi:hypothetical protein